MYVVLIGTAGNQRYIFSSGKRQEIVGASDLIARVNGTWADEALAAVFDGFERSWRLQDGHDAELLIAGAGTITVLVEDPAKGRSLVTRLTLMALERAPGLDVCGVVAEVRGSLAQSVKRARAELAAVRESRPGPQARFLRLPLVEDCGSSGLPAEATHREGADEPVRTRSAASGAKLKQFRDALDRLAEVAGTDSRTMRKVVDRLGLEADWVAVVHADGNGFGDIFRTLDEFVEGTGDAADAAYAETLRNLSQGVDDCAKRAFREALRRTARDPALKDTLVTSGSADDTVRADTGDRAAGSSTWSAARDGVPPVLPLVLGGDDLTVVCEGSVALPFTRHYLEAFEEETARDRFLAPVLARLERAGLGAAAGVAIVKRNYPFRFAYDLAEELISAEAKRVKAWGSALAFTVLFESSAPDLARIRRSATLSGGSVTSASPYLVGAGSRDARAGGRRWSDLESRVDALRRRDPQSGEPLIPRGAAHDLREGLCLGGDVAEARLALLRQRFAGHRGREEALADLVGEPGRLVWNGHDDGDHDDGEKREKKVTGLLDAMAALPFLRAGEGTA